MMLQNMILLSTALSSALAALALNPVNPDAVQTSSAASTTACKSAHLFDGTACNADTTCAAQYYLNVVDQTKTEAPISLEPGRVIGTNSIEIVVQHAAVLDRMVTKIELNPANAACNYPGANWKKGVQSGWASDNGRAICRDTYVSSIPWATDCNMARNENATHVWFLGKGTVFYDDSLGQLDGMSLGARKVSSVVQFAIYQPKVIRDISTQVRILDEPRLLGAITRQLFDFSTGNATLTVALSLAAPLRTTGLTTSTAPTGIAMDQVGAVDNSLCGDGKDAVCQQKYTFSIDPQVLCQLDGTYSFSFNVACHPSIANTPDCPTGMTQTLLSVSVTLDSEDICEVVQGLLALNGTITPHGEFSATPTFQFGPLKTAFFQDQTLQFQVQAKSLNGFPFDSSKIILVQAQDKLGARKTLYDASATGAVEGWSFAFNSDPANNLKTATTHRHQFSYVAAPAVFGDVERNLPIDSDVVVAVQVSFVNPVGPGAGRKRSAVVYHHLAARQLTTNQRAAQADTVIRVEAANATPAAVTKPVVKGTDKPIALGGDDELIHSGAANVVVSTMMMVVATILMM